MPNSSFLISVVIPTYNRRAFLTEAITSVIEQTYNSWELIVVDDGSADGTFEAVKSFNDDRITYLRQEKSGVSAARNLGVSKSSSPFIAFLDSDDLWFPKKLKTQLDFFDKHPNQSICQTEEIWVRNGCRVNPKDKHQKHSGWIFKECIPLCIVSPSAVMMKRGAFDALGGFDESLPACEDYDLWLRAALRYEIHTLPEPLIVKRGGHDDQLSKEWGLDRYRIRALEKALHDPMLDDDLKPLILQDIARRAKVVADGARKRNKLSVAQEYVSIAHNALEQLDQ